MYFKELKPNRIIGMDKKLHHFMGKNIHKFTLLVCKNNGT